MGRDIKAGGAFVEIFGKDAGLKKALSDSQKRLLKFANAATSIGKNIFKGLGAIAIPAIFSTKLLVNFSDKMLEVKAVTQATADQFRALEKEARRLGATTSFTAQQVAAGMAELGRAGFGPEQIIAALDSILALSRATSTDLAEATKIATATLNVFGLAASDAGRVADVLTATANSSALGLLELGEALKLVGPIAFAAGETLEDVAAAIGILANNGVKGTTAGTSLARAFKELAKTAKAAKLKDITGVVTTDSLGNLRKLGDILRDVGLAAKDFPTAKRLAVFEEIFGRGQIAAIALSKAGSSFEDLSKKIKESAGVAQKTSKIMDSGLGGVFRRLLSAAQDLAIEFGESLRPLMEDFIAEIRKAIPVVSAFLKENGAIISSFIKWAAILGTTAIAIALTSRAILFMSTSLVSVKSAIPFLIKSMSVFRFALLSPIKTIANLSNAMFGFVGSSGASAGFVGSFKSAIFSAGKFALANKLLIAGVGALGIALIAGTAIIIAYSNALNELDVIIKDAFEKADQDIEDLSNAIDKSGLKILRLKRANEKAGISELQIRKNNLKILGEQLEQEKNLARTVAAKKFKVDVAEERRQLGFVAGLRDIGSLIGIEDEFEKVFKDQKENLDKQLSNLNKETTIIDARKKLAQDQLEAFAKEGKLLEELQRITREQERTRQRREKEIDKVNGIFNNAIDSLRSSLRKQLENTEKIGVTQERQRELQKKPGEDFEEFQIRTAQLRTEFRKEDALLLAEKAFESEKKQIQKKGVAFTDEQALLTDLRSRFFKEGDVSKGFRKTVLGDIFREIEKQENNKAQAAISSAREVANFEKEESVKEKLFEIRNAEEISEERRSALFKELRGIDIEKLTPERLQERLAEIELGPKRITDLAEARGAFSPQAVKALAIGGAKVQDKILEENKKTAKNTAKLLNKKGLAFK